jgi:nucleoid-associated protein YgaU
MSEKKSNEITPYKSEESEIVKRIVGPEPTEEVSYQTTNDYYTDTSYENRAYHEEEYYFEEEKKPKSIFPIFAGVMVLGIIGYLGLNVLNQNSTETEKRAVAGVSSTNSTVIQGTTKEELINYYVHEALDNKTQGKAKEETIKIVNEMVNKELEKTLEKKSVEPVPVKKEPESEKTELSRLESEIAKEIPKEIIKETPKEKVALSVVEKPVVKTPIVQEESVVIEEPQEIIQDKEPVVQTPVITHTESKPVHLSKRVKRKKIEYRKIKPRIITVREGDSLASIAERFYGDEMDFKRIIRANSRIRNEHTPLHVGQKLIIPRKDGKKRRRFITVEAGDTLVSVSKAIYGTTDMIPLIVRSNKRIKSKRSFLYVGQKVYVPRLEFFK